MFVEKNSPSLKAPFKVHNRPPYRRNYQPIQTLIVSQNFRLIVHYKHPSEILVKIVLR